jgi:site-specific DNA recombinase
MTTTDLAKRSGSIHGTTSRRAVIYLRTSTNKQPGRGIDPEGYSLPAQRHACARKVEVLRVDIVGEYIDRGESVEMVEGGSRDQD